MFYSVVREQTGIFEQRASDKDRLFAGDFSQHQAARLPFHQRCDLAVLPTERQVTSPMPWDGSVGVRFRVLTARNIAGVAITCGQLAAGLIPQGAIPARIRSRSRPTGSSLAIVHLNDRFHNPFAYTLKALARSA